MASNKTDLIIGGTIVSLFTILFIFISFMVVKTTNSSQARYNACIEKNMQWIDGSCVSK